MLLLNCFVVTVRWAADNVIGEPRVYPSYSDINGAWAQGSVNVNEFIVVG